MGQDQSTSSGSPDVESEPINGSAGDGARTRRKGNWCTDEWGSTTFLFCFFSLLMIFTVVVGAGMEFTGFRWTSFGSRGWEWAFWTEAGVALIFAILILALGLEGIIKPSGQITPRRAQYVPYFSFCFAVFVMGVLGGALIEGGFRKYWSNAALDVFDSVGSISDLDPNMWTMWTAIMLVEFIGSFAVFLGFGGLISHTMHPVPELTVAEWSKAHPNHPVKP